MLNHGHPASLFCKKTVLKLYQELEKAVKLENSDWKIPDRSQPHDGTAPPPPGARHVRSAAGLGGQAGAHPVPLRALWSPSSASPRQGWTRITTPPAGSDCRRCRLRSAPAAGSPAGPGSLRTHGLTGRHRPPAPPPSRAGSAPAPLQDRSERTLQSSGAARNPAGERAGGSATHAGLQQPLRARARRPARAPLRTSAAPRVGAPERLSPLRARRPCPAPTPSRPLTKFARRAGGVRGTTWGRRRAKRSPAVLKDARRAETAGPADSVSSSYSGCRPCPPARRAPGPLPPRLRHTAPPPGTKFAWRSPGRRLRSRSARPGAAATSSSSERRREPRAQPEPLSAGAAALPARSSGTAQRRMAPPAGQGGKSPTHCPPQPPPGPAPLCSPHRRWLYKTGRSGWYFRDLCSLSEGPR